MLNPPFKLASTAADAVSDALSAQRAAAEYQPIACCDESHSTVSDASEGSTQPGTVTPSRARLADLDPHLHCSVIGTCLGTAELRKLMARHLFVRDASDLEVHHEAVSMASRGGAVTKALQKVLDQKHDAVVQRFSRARDAQLLTTLWDEALRQGEVPGAYWAVLTHRHVTPELRQKVFGDVHMLSHLVGAANRADIRRLVALERDNAELRDRLERQQVRTQELIEDRDIATARAGRAEQELAERDKLIASLSETADRSASDEAAAREKGVDVDSTMSLIALQTERRERAEHAAAAALEEARRLQDELDHLSRHALTMGRELAAAEAQLQLDPSHKPLEEFLRGRRILYVGGRPSSTPAIRDLVVRHGGEFQRHDGGLEDRKGLLASSVAWAKLVVFPVDCIDHDSATNLKRLCTRQGVAYLPLRSASVASFAAALPGPLDSGADDSDDGGSSMCIKHG
jgi:hypothetical protein